MVGAAPRYRRYTSEVRAKMLVEAGLACLAQGGIRAFTVDNICKVSGASRGLITHRKQRENQILKLLGQAPQTIPAMVAVMYAMVDKKLHPAAGRSVLAHLIDLEARGVVVRDGEVWRMA